MAPRETRSNAPMPSTDNKVEFASMSVNACATWAMHSLPALRHVPNLTTGGGVLPSSLTALPLLRVVRTACSSTNDPGPTRRGQQVGGPAHRAATARGVPEGASVGLCNACKVASFPGAMGSPSKAMRAADNSPMHSMCLARCALWSMVGACVRRRLERNCAAASEQSRPAINNSSNLSVRMK